MGCAPRRLLGANRRRLIDRRSKGLVAFRGVGATVRRVVGRYPTAMKWKAASLPTPLWSWVTMTTWPGSARWTLAMKGP